jgi:hypothetical protein
MDTIYMEVQGEEGKCRRLGVREEGLTEQVGARIQRLFGPNLPN